MWKVKVTVHNARIIFYCFGITLLEFEASNYESTLSYSVCSLLNLLQIFHFVAQAV